MACQEPVMFTASHADNCPDSLKEALLEAILREIHCDDVCVAINDGHEDGDPLDVETLGVTSAAICARLESVLAFAENVASMFCLAGGGTPFCQRLTAALDAARRLHAAFCTGTPVGIAAQAGKCC